MSELSNILEQKFVHLHCHSDYSLYDGFQKIASIVDRASELGMKGIAITDHGKVGSYIKFYKACKKKNIKPIFGIEAYLCHNLDNGVREPRYHITLLAKNIEGYRNILRLATESHRHIVKIWGNEIPRISFEMLKKHGAGLVVLSGCIASEFSTMIVEKKSVEAAKHLAKQYKDIWGDDYYIEVMWTKFAPQLEQMKNAEIIAKELDIKIVATNDAHFSYREDAKYQTYKIALSRKKPYFPEGNISEYYIKSYQEMSDIFKGKRLEYLHNTMEVLDKCNVDLVLGKAQLPNFEVPKNNLEFNEWRKKLWGKNDEQAYLQFLSEKGLKALGLWDDTIYRERLYKELETISFTGFTRYFLIVWDYVYWARQQDILVSKGRGCFCGDNIIVTDCGRKPINKVVIGDRVWSHDGKLHDVTNIHEYEINENILEIETIDGRKIACTEDHEILILKDNRKIWVRAKDLLIGDNVFDIVIPDINEGTGRGLGRKFLERIYRYLYSGVKKCVLKNFIQKK